jgi:hypothetical protein
LYAGAGVVTHVRRRAAGAIPKLVDPLVAKRRVKCGVDKGDRRSQSRVRNSSGLLESGSDRGDRGTCRALADLAKADRARRRIKGVGR